MLIEYQASSRIQPDKEGRSCFWVVIPHLPNCGIQRVTVGAWSNSSSWDGRGLAQHHYIWVSTFGKSPLMIGFCHIQAVSPCLFFFLFLIVYIYCIYIYTYTWISLTNKSDISTINPTVSCELCINLAKSTKNRVANRHFCPFSVGSKTSAVWTGAAYECWLLALSHFYSECIPDHPWIHHFPWYHIVHVWIRVCTPVNHRSIPWNRPDFHSNRFDAKRSTIFHS